MAGFANASRHARKDTKWTAADAFAVIEVENAAAASSGEVQVHGTAELKQGGGELLIEGVFQPG